MRIINNFQEYKLLEGILVGSSPWHTIDQKQIDRFAKATLDHQWIHINEERAANESPYGSTIAHGYLTLSLIPYLWKQIASVQNVSVEVNYGIEDLRFGVPVKVNSRVSLQATIRSVKDLRGMVKVIVGATLVVENESRPAYTGDVVFLYQFK
ncbi:MaoC family dehydratase [Chryseobacterium sp. SSA4.19]|uniref:MaoC family dehydratase n=1 Tax=unclassified Chryseobacterium TaxID=2593645 RepID=UPI001F4E4E3F|nr:MULTISPECIES: MaoC family dehydratase [unclassified Chryseobacterium]MCJ8154178.1 MaoC family dehydratase [Chryseobacterium sp. SSA4.19]